MNVHKFCSLGFRTGTCISDMNQKKTTFHFSPHPHQLNNGDTSNEERQGSAIEQMNPLSFNQCPEGN